MKQNKLNSFISEFLHYFKKHYLFSISLLISSVIFLYGTTMLAVPFDRQCESEILNSMNIDAKNSEFGLSLNSVKVTPKGNSDFYIYSDNELQDFQMRNQQNEGVRDYVFCAYEHSPNNIAFKYKDLECTSILFESKFEENNFYFKLPLKSSGTFPRFYYKNDIFVLDKLAEKIIGQKETYKDYDDLVKKTNDNPIPVTSIGPNGSSAYSCKIKGVLSSENKLGQFLIKCFGEDLVFMPEFNIFPIQGSLYFCGSTNYVENKEVVNFVYNKYVAKNSSARDLETGYNIEYKFYSYNTQTSKFENGERNQKLNSVLTNYKEKSLVVCVVGSIITITFLGYILVASYKCIMNRMNISRSVIFAAIWIVQAISLLAVSLLYKYLPVIAMMSKIKFTTYSHVSSTIVFLCWVFTTLILSLFIIKKPKLTQRS